MTVPGIPDKITFAVHHKQLVFNDDTHQYTLGDGTQLESVTAILKAEGIQQYGPRNPDADFKMQVGAWVHQAIAWYEHGTLDEPSLSDGVRAYLESYKKFKELTGFKPIPSLMEVPMWHSAWRYSGTPDLPGVIAGRFVVVDLKTGEKRAGDGIQIAAYGDLISNSVIGFERICPEGIVLHLKEDGSMPRPQKYDAKEMHGNRNVFFAVLQTHRWKKANGLI